MSEYQKRAISLTFRLGEKGTPPTFDASGGTANTVTVTGLRVQATISQSAGPFQTDVSLRIFGMSLSDMNNISTLGKNPMQTNFATVVNVSAGNVGGPMAVVFTGNVKQAWVDAGSPPDVALVVVASTVMGQQMMPVPATSWPGTVPVATILKALATQMGWTLENNGVTAVLRDQYLPGTGMQQILRTADNAHVDVFVDGKTLAIWPRGGNRGQKQIPLISPETGMIGYPAYTQQGCDVRMIYNPYVLAGGQIKVQSALKPACGVWPVTALEHTLESETPGGAWETRAKCVLNFGGASNFIPNA